MSETYTRVNWANGQAGGTPESAANFNVMDSGIDRLYKLVNGKGDLIVALSADTLDRLGVGANGRILMADSVESVGLKWALDPVTDLMAAAGDIPYASGADAMTKLTIGASTRMLGSTGSAPSWLAQENFPVTFTTYAPSWTSSGTQPAIGNGTLTGRYVRIGDFIRGSVSLTAGSTTTFGTGSYSISIPVAADGTITNGPIGVAIAVDTGANRYVGAARLNGSTAASFLTPASPGVAWSSTVPFTLAYTDQIQFEFSYEAA